MSKLALAPQSAFGLTEPLSQAWTDFELREVNEQLFFSIAPYRDATDAFNQALKTAFSIDLPGPGKFTQTANNLYAIWGGHQQWFLSVPHPSSDKIMELTADIGAITDQSDAWSHLRLTGSNTRLVLSRLCQLDLSDRAFPTGSATRTVMEHIQAIILCEDALHGQFRLITPRSSAQSFLTAIRHAADGCC